MTSHVLPGGLWIRETRLRAGLTQKELAERLETSQSLIALGTGVVEPAFGTVINAVRACGLELSVRVVSCDHDHDVLIKENLKLSPAERLQRMQEVRKGLDELVAASGGQQTDGQ